VLTDVHALDRFLGQHHRRIDLLLDVSKNRLDLYGRGNISTGKTESGFNNNAGVGKTGKIIATSNSPTPGTYTFTVVLWCKKQ
jgi:hypothetical protein